MRIALAQVSQESNTFSPERTGIEDFQHSSLLYGAEVLEQGAGDGIIDGVRAFFEDKREVRLVPILCANSAPGGRMSGEAARFLSAKLTECVRTALPFDALLISLHGATVSEDEDDVCGALLRETRVVVGGRIPILAVLDHHANLTRLMMENADMVVGFETQPHDLPAAGMKGARALYRLLRQRTPAARAWVKVPMIAPQDQFLTSAGPMKKWFAHAREMERDAGVISISLFPMQPWIDVREGGWGVAAYAEGDPLIARRAVRVLAEEAWRLREEFWVSDRVAPNLAVQRAAAEPDGLVLLSDMGDAVYAGGPGDSTCLLGELWRQKVPILSCLPLVDPVAVRQALDRGLGSIDLSMGGKTDPASRPISLRGRVTAISSGLRIVTEKGQTDLGRTALFEAGNLRIVLAEHRSLALIQPVLFTHLGLDLEKMRIVVMKTGSNFQFFDRWRRKLIRVDSPGVTQSDLKALSWTHLPRPLYPLDDLRCWDPEGLIHE